MMLETLLAAFITAEEDLVRHLCADDDLALMEERDLRARANEDAALRAVIDAFDDAAAALWGSQ